jgi:hypothetical protein
MITQVQRLNNGFCSLIAHPLTFRDLAIVGFVRGWDSSLTRIHPDAHPKRIERGASAVSAK